jgi:hypothetical protein
MSVSPESLNSLNFGYDLKYYLFPLGDSTTSETCGVTLPLAAKIQMQPFSITGKPFQVAKGTL